jgi:hypothetical protein
MFLRALASFTLKWRQQLSTNGIPLSDSPLVLSDFPQLAVKSQVLEWSIYATWVCYRQLAEHDHSISSSESEMSSLLLLGTREHQRGGRTANERAHYCFFLAGAETCSPSSSSRITRFFDDRWKNKRSARCAKAVSDNKPSWRASSPPPPLHQ